MPTSPTILCRLVLPEQAGDPAALHNVLQRHLRHSRLAGLLVHINGRLQAYILTAGCSGCASQSCSLGCYRELLQRGLRSVWGPAAELHPISRLVERPYSRSARFVPGRWARPLPADLLAAWPEARLLIGWSARTAGLQAPGAQPTILAAARLDLGPTGPEPQPALAEYGWTPAPQLALIAGLQRGRRPAGNTAAQLHFPRPQAAWPDRIFLLVGGA